MQEDACASISVALVHLIHKVHSANPGKFIHTNRPERHFDYELVCVPCVRVRARVAVCVHIGDHVVLSFRHIRREIRECLEVFDVNGTCAGPLQGYRHRRYSTFPGGNG